jgi:hypothetical protein
MEYRKQVLAPPAWMWLLAASVTIVFSTHARDARAQLCFQTPGVIPGLSGPPIWTGAGVIRTDVSDPRWAAAPLASFESDLPGTAANYRVLMNAARDELSVSIQARVGDPNPPAAAYFGISSNSGPVTSARAVRLTFAAGSPAGAPTAVTTAANWTYAGGAFGALNIGIPAWISSSSAWSTSVGGGLVWAIHFKVSLPAVGVVPGNPYRMFLGLVAGPMNMGPQSTPDSTALAKIPNSQIIPLDPNLWAAASAVDAACPAGIEIQGFNIGTTNASPSIIDTSNGATNTFVATPSYPGGVPPAGTIQGRFRMANWGTIADPAAGWGSILNGDAVPSSAAGPLSFSCPTNTATTTCGGPVPAEDHQCVLVELRAAPGQSATFSKASAYRNMDFVDLSELRRQATISVKGLQAVLGNSLDRDVYLYVKTTNMPVHGDDPLWLPAGKMFETRRAAEAPPRSPSRIDLRRAAALRPTANPPADAASAPKPEPEVEPHWSAHQALSEVWPTYEVFAYYDTGKTYDSDGGGPVKWLRSMYPWGFFLAHDGPLYGFSHAIEGIDGAKLERIAEDLYLVRIANEGSVRVRHQVVAHEKPRSDTPCPACPKHGPCNCRLPGGSPGSGALGWLLLAGVPLLLVARQRRRRAGAEQG